MTSLPPLIRLSNNVNFDSPAFAFSCSFSGLVIVLKASFAALEVTSKLPDGAQ